MADHSLPHTTGFNATLQAGAAATVGELISPAARPVVSGVYVHIPFCFHKCHYCDFYSIVDRRDRQKVFVDRLIDELRSAREFIAGPVKTIFVGGGTPTLLAPPLWQRLLDAMHQHLPLDDVSEWTVEANPETMTEDLAATLARGGVNRMSVGAQSFQADHLKTLERWHDPLSVSRAALLIRDAGIDNINLDLIFGVPGQSLADWESDLDAALSLNPTHLSCYSLTYEPNTPMTVRLHAGEFVRMEEDTEADMYERTQTVLADAGYEHYEISNWAMPGFRCTHNLAYWNSSNWWPLGPSAAGHLDGLRWKNIPHLGEYLDSAGLPPATNVERLNDTARRGEHLMLQLRLNDGIPIDALDDLVPEDDQRRSSIDQFVRDNLMERTDSHVRLTDRGRLIADSIFAELL